MLDLTALVRRLTQGQPQATMTLAIPNQQGEPAMPSTPEAGATLAASTPAPAPVDPHAVARRVYDLMLRDLAAEEARRGGNKR